MVLVGSAGVVTELVYVAAVVRAFGTELGEGLGVGEFGVDALGGLRDTGEVVPVGEMALVLETGLYLHFVGVKSGEILMVGVGVLEG